MNYYIDSNIFIRHLTNEPQRQATKAKKIIRALEENKITGKLSVLVINEVLWIMENYYEIPRNKFIPEILLILNLKGIKTIEIGKKNLNQILLEFQDLTIDFTDLYLNKISNAKTDIILSFDKHFDNLAIKRIEQI